VCFLRIKIDFKYSYLYFDRPAMNRHFYIEKAEDPGGYFYFEFDKFTFLG